MALHLKYIIPVYHFILLLTFVFSMYCMLFVNYSSLCYALSCRKSFSESMSADIETFTSQHHPAGMLNIVGCSQSYDRLTLKLGQHFENVEQFKDALHNNSIRQNFGFIIIKNDKLWVTFRCIALNCQWHLHASKEENVYTL